MFLEILALSGILYVGFKNFKKQRDLEKLGRNTSAQTTGTMAKLTQILQDTGNHKIESKPNHFSALKKNQREMVTASIAMGLSSVGTWLYYPLAFFSVPFTVYASLFCHKATYESIKQGKTNVEMMISMTIVGCLILGSFFVASLVAFITVFAEKLIMRVTHDSKQQLVGAFEQQLNFVWIMVEEVEIRIPFHKLQKNDIVVIHTGETIPADGTVVKGMASVDQHILTGETRPIEKEPGDEVFASTVVLSGNIQVKVEKTGQESTVAKITHILNTTIDLKSTAQLRADQLSKQLVNPTLIASCVALPLLGLNGALAVVNAHPKTKMMVIAPISILNYFNLASKQGILIKDGRSLELLNQVDTIVFDKTGTLTEEQPHIGRIYCYLDETENNILVYASAAEYKQKHPLAKAILQEAVNRQLSIPSIKDSEYKLGYGIIVNVAGQTVHVGSNRFMEVENILIPLMLIEQQKQCHEEGYSLVVVAVDKQIIGAIELLPTVRSEAKAVIQQLKQRSNIKATYIISGDNEVPTQKLAKGLGIDHYFAETLPEEKASLIEQLQQEGHFICYIGDGINDSIAMKKSHVSVSLRGASTIATDTAQIILMDNGITHLNSLFELANDFNTNMNRMFDIVTIPAILCVSGAFLFGFGVAQTVALNITSTVLALAHAMTPLLKQPEKQLTSEVSKLRIKNHND